MKTFLAIWGRAVSLLSLTRRLFWGWGLVIPLALAGCGNSPGHRNLTGTSFGNQPYACTIPCLNVAPALSVGTIAVGGSVTVTVTPTANASSVTVFLYSNTAANLAGSNISLNPVALTPVGVAVTVLQGTPLGTYLPVVQLANGADKATYMRVDTFSMVNYTYLEQVGGNVRPQMTAPFAIPYLTVQ